MGIELIMVNWLKNWGNAFFQGKNNQDSQPCLDIISSQHKGQKVIINISKNTFFPARIMVVRMRLSEKKQIQTDIA